jgi:hypothetical protein
LDGNRPHQRARVAQAAAGAVKKPPRSARHLLMVAMERRAPPPVSEFLLTSRLLFGPSPPGNAPACGFV